MEKKYVSDILNELKLGTSLHLGQSLCNLAYEMNLRQHPLWQQVTKIVANSKLTLEDRRQKVVELLCNV